MKKLKIRIKRALAAFLRDELLEYIGYQEKRGYRIEPVVINQVDMECVTLEHVIDLRYTKFDLDFMIEKAKKQFADKIIEHTEVNAQNLVHHHFSPDYKKITLRLIFQKKRL